MKINRLQAANYNNNLYALTQFRMHNTSTYAKHMHAALIVHVTIHNCIYAVCPQTKLAISGANNSCQYVCVCVFEPVVQKLNQTWVHMYLNASTTII